ncbi:alpha/beta fold hydrolase [Hathewaya histolytica]|uniref:Prolyl aminopeptidase n=1 Tax=Hathewaya histolytica TaxID=1498 RepID=A0A4U9RDI2_HATHI|nr:alpha/beta fold hydrolase [Hathewaya histolytica]VTQ89031.1 prolyl aminopeptidase [Hathewaya histolytica]
MERYINIDKHKLYIKTMGKGEPILFIHGGPGLCHNYFLPYLEGLSDKNTLIFYDQRGNGKSFFEIGNDDEISLETFIDDIEFIRTSLNIDRLNIFGHSMGGFLAINYALKYGDNVNKLVLSNSIPLRFEDFNQMNVIKRNKIHPMDFKELIKLQNSKKFKDYNEEIFMQYISILEKSSFINDHRAYEFTKNLNFQGKHYKNFLNINVKLINEYMYNIRFKDINIEKIKCPTLIVFGTNDFIPHSSLEYLSSNIKKSDVKYIDNAAHYPFIEEKEKMISILKDFFQ